MKHILLAGAASLLTLTAAIAQTTTPSTTTTGPSTTNGTTTPAATLAPNGAPATANANSNDSNAAVTTDRTSSGPAKGANSFTAGQAQGRIADAGFSSVADLKKDGDGIWRGSAMKGGQKVAVWCDYKGNVGQQ